LSVKPRTYSPIVFECATSPPGETKNVFLTIFKRNRYVVFVFFTKTPYVVEHVSADDTDDNNVAYARYRPTGYRRGRWGGFRTSFWTDAIDPERCIMSAVYCARVIPHRVASVQTVQSRVRRVPVNCVARLITFRRASAHRFSCPADKRSRQLLMVFRSRRYYDKRFQDIFYVS